MNLGARIFGVSLYVLSLLFFCLLVGKVSRKNRKRVLAVYALVLGLMGFFFVPNPENDLYRTYEIMHNYSNVPFGTFFNDYVIKSSVPITMLYYWVIGQTGINGLLPLISTLIVYFNIFYIFNDYAGKRNISGKALSFGLFIIMCSGSFIEVISSIRNMLAFSILLRCFYNEIYNDKSMMRSVFWYFVAAFIHSASIAVIIIRLIFALFQKSKTRIRKVLLVVSSFLVSLVMFVFGNQFVVRMIEKGDNYVNGNIYSYGWGMAISIILLIAVIVMQLRLKTFTSEKADMKINLFNNMKLSHFLEIIMILLVFEYSIFYRFGILNLLLNIPVILSYFCESFRLQRHNYRYVFLLFVCILLLTCTRGNLSALKFWSGV